MSSLHPCKAVSKNDKRNRNQSKTYMYPKNIELHIFGYAIAFAPKTVKVNLSLPGCFKLKDFVGCHLHVCNKPYLLI